jgi:hypothetical protein
VKKQGAVERRAFAKPTGIRQALGNLTQRAFSTRFPSKAFREKFAEYN